MPRITPIHWKVLVCIFERAGFTLERQKGSHLVFSREGTPRSIVIPKYKEIEPFIIKNNMRSAGMDRDTYFQYLADCE